MNPILTIDELIHAARRFCEIESRENHIDLIGVTDGKAVGTYVEHKFQHFLQSQYRVDIGSMAYVAMLLLNSEKVQGFLTSIAFLDAKRPYTKKVLERIDFDKIVASLTIDELTETEQKLNLSYYVTIPMYDSFKSLLGVRQLSFV